MGFLRILGHYHAPVHVRNPLIPVFKFLRPALTDSANYTETSTCSFCDIGMAFIVALAAFGVLIAF